MFIYLHGFASSPRSTKAQDLRDRFAARNIPLIIPDLNQNDFTHLTLTRQLQQVKSLLPVEPPITLIGSSFGGLTAAWLGQQCAQVTKLVLLAPAFQYLEHWLPTLAPLQLEKWQAGEPLQVYHYGDKRLLPLDYQLVSDLQQYDITQLQKPVPTLILHGVQDDVIPIQASRAYARSRSWVNLIELESDHLLIDQRDTIWTAIDQFCS